MRYQIEENELDDLLGSAADLDILASVGWAMDEHEDLKSEDLGNATSRVAQRVRNVCIRIEERLTKELREADVTSTTRRKNL